MQQFFTLQIWGQIYYEKQTGESKETEIHHKPKCMNINSTAEEH